MGRPWSEERIRRELDALLPGHDAWPSYTEFRAAGRRELWEALARHGGPARFAEEYGLPYAFKRHAWSDAQVRERLRAALRGSDVPMWPSPRWLAAHGGMRLVSAINRSGGATRWARELGVPLRRRQPWTPQRIDTALTAFVQGRRTWPSRREFEQAGLGGLYAAIRHGRGAPSARQPLTACRCSARAGTGRPGHDAPDPRDALRAPPSSARQLVGAQRGQQDDPM